MSRLQPYPAMKDSGVEWLGEVPEHWEVRRLKTLFREKDQRSGDGRGLLLSLTRSRGIVPQSQASNRMASASDLSKYKVCRPGDLVMNRMQAWSGVFAVSAIDGLVSPDYSVFEVTTDSDTEVRYFEKLFRTPTLVGQFARKSKGIGSGFNRLYTDDFGGLPATAPPFSEQAAIVRYLDHVDRRVRRLVRAKRKLIALLTEQKQVLIHRAVTRGLDPDVPLKDSGVEWLGEVPEHWEVRRSKQTFTPRKELAKPNDIQLSATQAYGVIAQDEYERRVGRKIVKISRHLEKRRHVRVNDFVISMRSFQGGLERAWSSGCIRSSYVVIRPIIRVNVSFFAYLFKSCGYIGALQSTADFIRDGQDLNFDNFCRVDLPVPPVEEQRYISKTLDAAVSQANAAAEQSQREIDLLNEYRTCLIADVVTGKLDVRSAAASLPKVDPLDTEDNQLEGTFATVAEEEADSSEEAAER